VIAAALPAGSEVLSYEGDFASVLFPFMVAADRGIDVRLVELDELADAVGPRTSLVAFSAVQSSDGAVADLEGIAAAAAAHDALTYVDATQAIGWLPFDAANFDFVAASAYKWLLCPRGASFMAVRPERLELLPPIAAGWYSQPDPWASIYGPDLRLAPDARRLDLAPAWLAFVGAVPALEAIERTGVPTIHEHDVGLANRFRAGLGLPPSDSAIVSTSLPGAADKLARAGITVSTRAGGLRASFHLYNTDADVDRALEAL
jgi:selenocysteine lyase/cysteine desulfurase